MIKKIAVIQIAFAMLHAMSAHAAGAKCNPEKSKPCGKSCIRLSFTCHTPTPAQDAAVVATDAPKPQTKQ